MNIYSICYEFLTIIVDDLESVYADRDKETIRLIELLTGKKKYSETIRKDIESKGINVETLRKIMILTITSKAYMYENYSCIKNIHPDSIIELIQGTINTIEEMNYRDIIDLYNNKDDIIELLIDDFFSYYDLTYVGENQCKEFIFKDKTKLKHLLAINPYEVFMICDFIENKDFVPSELIIQDFFDIYEEVYSIICSEEDTEEDILSMDEEDESFYEEFLNLLQEKYSGAYVNDFLLYICSNVYETLITDKNYTRSSKAKNLVAYFIESSKEEILNDLKNDYEFSCIIIKYFYENNQFVSREELVKRRNKIKHDIKNLVTVQSLNPYYEKEEKIFTRIKTKS